MSTTAPGAFFTTATPANHIPDETASSVGYVENLKEDEIDAFFEIEETVEWIKNGNHTRIALQFPDSLLRFSEKVSKLIETGIKSYGTSEDVKKTFILADTSYRSCCVDEVAAAHANCTALVHFGEACHSAPTDKIDVKYVLGSMPLAVDEFKSKLQVLHEQLTAENVVLLMDSCYAHEEDKVLATIKETLPDGRNVVCASLPSAESLKLNRENVYLGRDVPSCLRNNLPTDLVFCGFPNSPLVPIWLLSFPTCHSVSSFDPNENTIQYEV